MPSDFDVLIGIARFENRYRYSRIPLNVVIFGAMDFCVDQDTFVVRVNPHDLSLRSPVGHDRAQCREIQSSRERARRFGKHEPKSTATLKNTAMGSMNGSSALIKCEMLILLHVDGSFRFIKSGFE